MPDGTFGAYAGCHINSSSNILLPRNLSDVVSVKNDTQWQGTINEQNAHDLNFNETCSCVQKDINIGEEALPGEKVCSQDDNKRGVKIESVLVKVALEVQETELWWDTKGSFDDKQTV